VSHDPCLPSEDDLVAERVLEDRFERWLLARQVAIVFVLVGLLAMHALLTGAV
jgi:hypothetical protein